MPPALTVDRDDLPDADEPDPSTSSGMRVAPGAPRLRAMRESFAELVWRAARRFGVSEADADDVVQEVFLVAAQKLAVIELGKERAFLLGTTLRMAAHVRRAKARRPEEPPGDHDPVDATPGPDELCDQRKARAMLDDVLDTMPLEVRAVFVLFELEEMTLAEIALVLALPQGTVASRLRRARELFQAAVTRLSARTSPRRIPR